MKIFVHTLPNNFLLIKGNDDKKNSKSSGYSFGG